MTFHGSAASFPSPCTQRCDTCMHGRAAELRKGIVMSVQRHLQGVLTVAMVVASAFVVQVADPFTLTSTTLKDGQMMPRRVITVVAQTPPAGQSTSQSVAPVQKLVDPFPTPIEANGVGVTVDFVEFATVPSAGASGTESPRLMLLVDEPATKRMFVNTM